MRLCRGDGLIRISGPFNSVYQAPFNPRNPARRAEVSPAPAGAEGPGRRGPGAPFARLRWGGAGQARGRLGFTALAAPATLADPWLTLPFLLPIPDGSPTCCGPSGARGSNIGRRWPSSCRWFTTTCATWRGGSSDANVGATRWSRRRSCDTGPRGRRRRRCRRRRWSRDRRRCGSPCEPAPYCRPCRKGRRPCRRLR